MQMSAPALPSLTVSYRGSQEATYTAYSHNISIQSNADYKDFFTRAKADLDKLASKPRGARLISAISGMPVRINYHPRISMAVADDLPKAQNGIGSGATVSYSARDGSFFIQLAHELCHVYRMHKGINQMDVPVAEEDKLQWKDAEEKAVVGPPNPQDSKDFEFTENGVRDEWGLEMRTSYFHSQEEALASNEEALRVLTRSLQNLGVSLEGRVHVEIQHTAR